MDTPASYTSGPSPEVREEEVLGGEWGAGRVPLVDLRSAEEFQTLHIHGATSLPWADGSLRNRASELPPRGHRMSVIAGSEAELAGAVEYLGSHYGLLSALTWAALAQDQATIFVSLPLPSPHVPPGSGFVLEKPVEFEVKLCPLSQLRLERSAFSQRIWEPSPVLGASIGSIERALGLGHGQTFDPSAPLTGPLALDLACGSGRDITFLALRGWKAVGVDYQEALLARARGLAQASGTLVQTLPLNIEKLLLSSPPPKATGNSAKESEKATEGSTAAGLGPLGALLGQCFLVNVSRYLHRPLFPTIKRLVREGGWVVFHSFVEGCTKPHKPRFLLQHGELRRVFTTTQGGEGEGEFEVVEDRIFRLSDGRPTSLFVARKLPTKQPTEADTRSQATE